MKAQAPWVIPSKELVQIARRYRVPIHILASVRGVKPEVIADAYRTANQREYYEFKAAASKKITFFGQPVGVKAERVKTKAGERIYITIRYPTAAVVWELKPEEFMKYDADTWLRMLTDWVYAKAELIEIKREINGRKIVRRYWSAKKVIFAKVEEDVETAKHLIERYKAAGLRFPILFAGAALLGYAPKAVHEHMELQLLVTMYLMPIVAAEPIHTVLLSYPGVGKTTVALLYKSHLRWAFYAEPPSLATLVGDARTGRSTIAGANGVWFDEFDKWQVRRTKAEQLAEIVEVLLTAMEQGYWQRSKGGEKAIKIHNEIPVVFTGNVSMAINPRDKVKQIVSRAAPDAVQAFDQRISAAVTIAADWSDMVMSATWEKVTGMQWIVKPSVLRGYMALTRELYIKAPEPESSGDFKGRYARSYKRVYKALMVLWGWPHWDSGEVKDVIAEFAKRLVRGWVVTDKTFKDDTIQV